MAVKFMRFRANDIERPLTLEDTFRRYGAWSGIHDFSFDLLAEDASLVVTAPAGDWEITEVADELPVNLIVRYHKTTHRQAVLIDSSDGRLNCLIGTNENGYPTVWSGHLILWQLPVAAPEEADVEVVFRQQVFDELTKVAWRTAALYMNGKHIATYSVSYPEVCDSLHVSFGAYDGDVVTYTNISIPQLCETVEFGTVDPGENPFGGLQRTIEGRYLKYFIRYNGALRAWRAKARDLLTTFGSSVKAMERATDLTQLATHTRMMGAFIWAEAVDQDLLKGYGQRFMELNNPMLMTEQECSEEAINSLKRSEEETFTLTFQAQHIPQLEPEDRVGVDGDDWVTSDYSFEVEGGKLPQTYNVRKYVWGS